MGKPIVYCEGCGKSLREEEFTQGRAHTVDHRPFCIECKPLPKAAKPLTASSTKSRRVSSEHLPRVAPTPPTTRRGPRSRESKAPLWIGLGVGAAFVIALIALLSSDKQTSSVAQEPAPVVPPPGPSPAPPTTDPAIEVIRNLETFSASSNDPDAILARCAEARRSLQGTPHLRRVLQIENRAREKKQKTEFVVPDRIEIALKSIRELIEGDKEFSRRADVLRMVETTSKSAGDRLPEILALRKRYEERFAAEAERTAREVTAKARELAAERLYSGALEVLAGYPAAFRSTPHGADVERLRKSIDLEWNEAESTARTKAASSWNEWTIVSEKERDAPKLHESWGGRENVYETHPFSGEKPATLGRTLKIPAEGAARLAVGVASHEKGDWKVRVRIDGSVVKEADVRGNPTEWTELSVDLASYAGKNVKIQLENAASDWSWEYGYWSHARLEVYQDAEREGEASFHVGLRNVKLHGKVMNDKGGHIGGWNRDGDHADWLVVVPTEGVHTVEMTYACNPGSGGQYRLTTGAGTLEGTVKPTGGWRVFKTVTLGTIEVAGGPRRIRMKAVKSKGGLLNLKKLTFTRK